MQINNFGFGAMATPQFDPGDEGYVAPNIRSPHGDAGDVGGFGYVEEKAAGIGVIAIVAIAAWFLLKR